MKAVNPYIHISAQEAQILKRNWRKSMPVCVQVNGKPDTPWRINMVPMGTGDFYLYLQATVRKAAGVKAGDIVSVRVWFDASYRNGPSGPMPTWFSQALRKNAVAGKAWKLLSPSRQKEVLRYLCRLQSENAKMRNLTLIIRALSGEPTHFLGRDWINGR